MSARSVDDHIAVLTALLGLPPAATEELPVAAARSRIIAEDIIAPLHQPPFDNSQMDGFAVRAIDLGRGPLRVGYMIAAGAGIGDHPAGTASPIMTGAPLPRGADTVIPVEQATPPNFIAEVVELPLAPAGQFVRRRGSDLGSGATAIAAGTRLTPPLAALASSLGLTRITVRAAPRVVVYSGGDEVVAPGRSLEPGQVYDANGTLLRALAQEAGLDVVAAHRITDEPESFRRRLEDDLARLSPDLVLSAGGISAGVFEVVRMVVTAAAEESWFGHVAMQPGGPQGCAQLGGVPVISLPGNPVSSWVSWHVLVRAALSAAWGVSSAPAWSSAYLAEDLDPLAQKTQFRRGLYAGPPPGPDSVAMVRPFGGASSHLLAHAGHAEVLIRVAPGSETLPSGSPVAILDVRD